MHGCEEFCPFGDILWHHLADVGGGLFVAVVVVVSLGVSLVLVEAFGCGCEEG